MHKVHGRLRIRLFHAGKLILEKIFDKPKVTIGRDPSCDLVIDNKLVSGRHAKVLRESGGYILEDLSSTNGTYLNGRKISREYLRVGAKVTIGKHSLEIIEEGESVSTNEGGDTTFVALTDETINVSPEEAEKLYAQAALSAFVGKGGELCELVVEKGKAHPPVVRLTGKLTKVGKGGDSDLALSGFFAPDVAFHVERTDKGYQLMPPPGSKKLLLNGEKVKRRALLKYGDLMAIGSTVIRFQRSR